MTVSLPKQWVTSNNLKPGDAVEIDTPPDGSLTIFVKGGRKKESTKSTVTVERGESQEHLLRKLIGAYLSGASTIEVRSKDRMDLGIKHEVKDFTRMVIGPEIIEETATTVVMLDLSDPVELPQRKCVRRMHLIVESMHRDAMVAYTDGDEELARDVMDRDQDIDRLYWMTVKQNNLVQIDRSLADRIGVDVFGSMSLTTVARILERVGDHAERISRQAIGQNGEEMKTSLEEALRGLSDQALDILSRAVSAFFTHDISSANLVIDQAKQLAKELDSKMPHLLGKGGKDTMSRTAVMNSLERTIMYATDIAEVAINDGMRQMMIEKGK